MFIKLYRKLLKAHFEIRELAKKILEEIPEEYQILFEDIVGKKIPKMEEIR
jgi:thymidylate synthase ThyX